jgi:hypothetical protein
LRRHFAIAGDDHGYGYTGEKNGPGTEASEEIRDQRWKAEDPASQDGVDGERDETPAADSADESLAGRGLGRGWRHGEFVSQVTALLTMHDVKAVSSFRRSGECTKVFDGKGEVEEAGFVPKIGNGNNPRTHANQGLS